MEEVVNVWSGSRLGLTYACLGVAWGHQLYSEKIVTCCFNAQCVVWDLNKSPSKVETYLTEHSRAVNRVTFHPTNSSFLLSASSDGLTKLWDLRRPFSSVATFRHNSPVHAACFSPQQGGGSTQFVVGLENGAIQRFDFRQESKGMTDWISSAHAGAVLDVKWRESGMNEEWGTWLASCGMDKSVKVWDLSHPTIPRTPKHVLRTATRNRRLAFRPGTETELVVVPQPYNVHGDAAGPGGAAGKNGAGVGGGQREMHMLSVWDVRRNWVAKYLLEGGTTVPTDVVFMPSATDTLVATYKDAHLVQHDFRHHRRPIDELCRTALSWDASGRMAFAAEERAEREIPFDEPPYDERTGIRTTGTIEQSCKGPRFAPVNQVAAGLIVPAAVDGEAVVRMARGYVLSGGEPWEVSEANAKVATSARHHKAAQAWQLLHALLLPLPLPSRSPSPSPFPALSTPAKSSKYSFSPLSSAASHSRRATSAGPSRTRRPRGGGRQGRALVGRKPASGGTTPLLVGETRARSDSTGSMQHVGEGALEDSDSDGEREDGADGEETDTTADREREREREKVSGHGRNLSSESGLGLGQLLSNMRSPLSQTPLTAGGMLHPDARLWEEPEGEEEEEEEAVLRTDTEGGTGTGEEVSESSSGRRRVRGSVRLAPAPASRVHTARRGSIETEVQSDPAVERGHRLKGSNGVEGSSPDKDKDKEGRRGRQRARRSRRDVVDAEESTRQAGWENARRVWEGFVSEGDVQTAAMLGIVGGEKLVKEEWRVGRIVQAYLDVLDRVQLYTSAAYIRKHYVNPEVHDLTNSGTIVASTCAKCGKPLRGQTLKPGQLGPVGHFAYCSNCSRSVTRCAICHLPSKGLFFSCPTCGHGGHEECYRDYYLGRPTENMQPVFSTQPLLPLHMLGSRLSSASSDSTALDEDDVTRTGRSTTVKKREPAPSARPRSSRVHAMEVEDDSEEEMMKERFWARREKGYKRVLLGHPCVAGCGHVCWVANDRYLTKA